MASTEPYTPYPFHLCTIIASNTVGIIICMSTLVRHHCLSGPNVLPAEYTLPRHAAPTTSTQRFQRNAIPRLIVVIRILLPLTGPTRGAVASDLVARVPAGCLGTAITACRATSLAMARSDGNHEGFQTETDAGDDAKVEAGLRPAVGVGHVEGWIEGMNNAVMEVVESNGGEGDQSRTMSL